MKGAKDSPPKSDLKARSHETGRVRVNPERVNVVAVSENKLKQNSVFTRWLRSAGFFGRKLTRVEDRSDPSDSNDRERPREHVLAG